MDEDEFAMIKTMTLHMDAAADRRLEVTLPRDLPAGPLDIVLVIAASEKPPATVNLAGRWQSFFPPNFNIEDALHDIRREWELEWPDTNL